MGVVENGLRMVVAAGIGLGIAEGRDAAELVEEVGEADVIAFHGYVGDLVAPGTNQVTGIGIGEVQLDALVDGAAEPAAEVVPGEPALKGEITAARGRLPVDNAALVVLGEIAGSFFKDGGGGVAPAFDAAGLVEVLEEVGLECGAVGELAGDVDHVVLQGVEEVGGGDFGGEEAGVGGAGGRGGGQGIGGEDEQGDIRAVEGVARA